MTAQTTITTRRDGDVLVLLLDVPGRTMNVVDDRVITDLRGAIESGLTDESLVGMVLTSGKGGSFGGGADLVQMPDLAAQPDRTREYLERVHDLVLVMVESPKPIVAAIDGYALGGALEIALACDPIIVTEHAQVGLPEATLGLIPAGGGTQLILRRLEPVDALEFMATGRILAAHEAVKRGIVDEVVRSDELLDRAMRHARGGSPSHRTFPEPGPAGVDLAGEAAGLRRPPSELALGALVDILTEGIRKGHLAGLAGERDHFLSLLQGDESVALIHLFHAETALKRAFRGTGREAPTLGVVGGGLMGAGIAATAVTKGLSAVVREVSEKRLAQIIAQAPDQARWQGTSGWEGFERADIVIEAVPELPDLKHETLRLIDEHATQASLIATNTSAIPIGSLATSVSAPERFLGTHFFSPVERMPLVELVPHAATAADALATAGDLVRRMGKTPVVVADRPGFFTSRVYARWLIEGLLLLIDGVPAQVIEAEARSAGFPVGPLQACDEVTLELVRDASLIQVASKVMAGRVRVTEARTLLDDLIAAGIRGKRFGRAFYAYVDGRRSGFDPDLATLVGAAQRQGVGLAAERLLWAFVSEALLCLDDGTIRHPDDGDVASVLGIGFPRRLGGPFHWIDQQGPSLALGRLEALGSPAFPTGAVLEQLAASDGRFANYPPASTT